MQVERDLVEQIKVLLDNGCQYKLQDHSCWEHWDLQEGRPEGYWCDHCWKHMSCAAAVHGFEREKGAGK